MALAQTKPYRISRLTQENGMYFENQGPLRLTNSDWKLLIYVKLDNFNQRTKDTMNFYKRTLITCNDLTIAYEGMFKTTCDNFKLASNSLEREVSRKRFYMLQSIDETDTVSREKRGLVNLVGRVQKTLFGTLDDTDAELYDRQIEKLQSSQQNLLKIIDKQTSVLKATANTFKEANKMEAQINRLSVLYNRMTDTVNQTIINLDIVEARTNINEQINILNLLFQQLSFETDTICEIIIAAQGGIMHSSVIAVNELRQQLKDISLIIPKEQSLPFNLNQVSLYELSKISKFNIIYKNETLIFEIVIPLVNSVELTLYHVIPLPVVKNDHYIHIIPEYSYIAISKTHEYYLTLCMNHLMLCRQTNMGTLCPETQPLRLGASELPCEVELFVKPSSIPISCPIHYLDITRSIYHRLKYQNAWIYTIKTTDNVAVSCENRDQAINIQLTGNGVLTLNEDCRGYTPQLVLTPSRHLNSTHYKDLISDVGITTNLTIPASLKQKISSGNTHTNSVIKLTDLGQYSKSIEEIEQLIQEEKDKQNILFGIMFLTVVKDLTTNFGSNYTNHCFAKPSSNDEIRVSDETFNTTFDETKVACTKIDVCIPEVKRPKVSTKVDYEHHSQHFFENTKEEMKITVYNCVIDKMLNGVKVRFSQDTLNLIDSVGIREVDDPSFVKDMEQFLKTLYNVNRSKVEETTRDQAESENWRAERMIRLTASNFGRVCKMRRNTSCKNMVHSILYLTFTSKSVQYGRDMEDEAKTKFEEKFGYKIKKCGLLIDTLIPYLAASPV
ncbi:hypothetical protein QTP88_020851 [Uroleucon formosanum]